MTVDELIQALEDYKKNTVAFPYGGLATVYVRTDEGWVGELRKLDEDEGRLLLEP